MDEADLKTRLLKTISSLHHCQHDQARPQRQVKWLPPAAARKHVEPHPLRQGSMWSPTRCGKEACGAPPAVARKHVELQESQWWLWIPLFEKALNTSTFINTFLRAPSSFLGSLPWQPVKECEARACEHFDRRRETQREMLCQISNSDTTGNRKQVPCLTIWCSTSQTTLSL